MAFREWARRCDADTVGLTSPRACVGKLFFVSRGVLPHPNNSSLEPRNTRSHVVAAVVRVAELFDCSRSRPSWAVPSETAAASSAHAATGLAGVAPTTFCYTVSFAAGAAAISADGVTALAAASVAVSVLTATTPAVASAI